MFRIFRVSVFIIFPFISIVQISYYNATDSFIRFAWLRGKILDIYNYNV